MRLGSLTKGVMIPSQDRESSSRTDVPLPSPLPDDLESRARVRELARLQAKLNANNLSTSELLEVARRIEELTPAAGTLVERALGLIEGHEREAISGFPAPGPRPTDRDEGEASIEECVTRGTSAHGRGQFEEAIAWYDRALAVDPDDPRAVAGKAESLKRLGRFDEAVSFYDRMLRRGPRDLKAWLGRAAALAGAGRRREAASSYEKVLQIDPTHPIAWNGRGVVLFAAGAIEQALRCFDRALATESRSVMARFNKAVAEDRLGRRSEAARSYSAFLDAAPSTLERQIEVARGRLLELRAR